MKFKNNFDRIFFFKIPTYLFILLPIFLISGPLFSDLSVSLIAILFFLYCLKYKNFSYFNNIYFYFFLAFYTYINLNSLFNNFNFDSIKISIFYFRFGVFVLALYYLLKLDNKFLKAFFHCLLFCFSILIIDGFWQFFFEKNLLGWPKVHEYRISSLFRDELILGSYISRLFPLLFGLGYLFYSNEKLKFFFLIIIFILSEILIFLSGERTSFFLINLSAFFIIFFSTKLKTLRFITLIISLFIIFLIGLFNDKAKVRMVDLTLNQMMPKKEINSHDDNKKIRQFHIFSIQHTHHYITAYRIYNDNKFTGVGVKNFRNFCNLESYRVSDLSCSTHPHNTYIQLLSETGLIGLSFLIIIIIFFSINLIKHIKKRFNKSYHFNDFEICILSGVLITLWPLVPTGNFFNNWLSIIYYISLPIIFWSFSYNKDKIKL